MVNIYSIKLTITDNKEDELIFSIPSICNIGYIANNEQVLDEVLLRFKRSIQAKYKDCVSIYVSIVNFEPSMLDDSSNIKHFQD